MRLNILKLRGVMLREEMTQTDLAEKAGLSRPTVNAICCGRGCKLETGVKIAEALGVTVEELRERG